MRAPVTSACLIIAVLAFPERPGCAAPAGPDTGRPVLYYFSAGGTVWHQSGASASTLAMRPEGYLGVSLKPVPFAWFHGGVKTRWLQGEQLSGVYGEPAVLNALFGLRVIPGLFHATGGFRIPMPNVSLPASDSSAFAGAVNGFTGGEEENLLPLNSLLMGGHLMHDFGQLFATLSLSYYKPSKYTLYSRAPAFHSSFFSYRGATEWRAAGMLHRMDWKWNTWSPERQQVGRVEVESHQEGNLVQGRYALRRHTAAGGMEYALGGAWKSTDRSRDTSNQLKMDPENSNIQRGWLEWSVLTPNWNTSLWRVWLAPQFLYRQSDGAMGASQAVETSFSFLIRERVTSKVTALASYSRIDDHSALAGSLLLSCSMYRGGKTAPGVFPPRKSAP